MSYTLRYNRDVPEEWTRAADDFIEYVGEHRAEIIIAGIADSSIPDLDTLFIVASFVGVKGFPVEAFGARHGVY